MICASAADAAAGRTSADADQAPVRKLRNTASQRFLATVVNTEPRFLPTLVMIVTAATTISAAIRPYSTAVAPSSFLSRAITVANISLLPRRAALAGDRQGEVRISVAVSHRKAAKHLP